MRMFLCLKDWCALAAGSLYQQDEHGRVVVRGMHLCVTDNIAKEVETFTKDNVTWIKHDGGDCPVPDGWEIEVLFPDGIVTPTIMHDPCSRVEWFWFIGDKGELDEVNIVSAYRILSTGEEESGAGGGIELGDKDESEINDTKENLSLMDTLTQNQRDYITRKELEQAEKQQAQEQEKADEIEHKQQQSNDLVRANGVFNDR